MGPLGVVVADVFEALWAYTADAVDGTVAAVAGGKDRVAFRIVFGEEISPLHPLGDFNSREGQRTRGHVDVFDQIVTDGTLGYTRPADDKGNIESPRRRGIAYRGRG